MSEADRESTAGPLGGERHGSLQWLVAIMRTLLGPGGCPWDREQTLDTLKPFLLEEAYELVEAIEEGDPDHHREELGDLLFQVVFQAVLAAHPMEQVIGGIGEKLIRRHPHVFGDLQVETSEQVLTNWERIKSRERGHSRGLLDGVPISMAALQQANLLSAKAAKVGFDWPDAAGPREKVREELEELDRAVASGDPEQMAGEAGDLLFAVVNWTRKLGLDPEEALRGANRRFRRRFAHIEQALESRGRTTEEASLEEMDRLWDEAKQAER